MNITKHKWCWLAKEYKKGWRLGLCIGNQKTKWLPFWFYSEDDISKVVKDNKTVYIHLDLRGEWSGKKTTIKVGKVA